MGEIEERWASINPDLLGEIVKRLHSYSDYIRLHLVCKEWKSALPKLPDQKKRWLVIPGPEDAFESEIRMLREENIYPIMLPEMKDNLIRGSSHGWLICVMMSDGAVRLLNPFTKAHIDLPPISAFPEVISYNPDAAEVDPYTMLDPRSGTINPASARIVHYIGVWKLVLSSPPDNDTHDFMAAAIYGVCCRLAFYRHSDGRWRDVPIPMAEPDFQDVIFVQDKIYAVDWTAQLYVFDAKTEPVPLGGICEAVPPPAFPDMSCYVCWNKYLINRADDSLLMLIRYLERDGCGDDTSGFLIFRLDKDAEQWLQIHTLGCCTLMVGNNSSECILTRPSPDSKSNRIYYTDNLSRYIDGHRRDIGIFNLEEESFKRLVFDEKFFCSPIWCLSPS